MGVVVERVKAKAANFSACYDGTEIGLYKKYDIPVPEGKALLRGFYKINPEVKAYHKHCDACIKEEGYVESIFGWRRHLPKDSNKHQRRQGYNQPIQNAAAVITYLSMLGIDRMLREQKLRSLMILNVHDSIGFDCPGKEVKKVAKWAKHIMMNVDYRKFTGDRLKVDIPLAVDVKTGEHL